MMLSWLYSTRKKSSASAESKESDNNEDNYGDIETRMYEKLFYFIRCYLLENPRLMTMVELKDASYLYVFDGRNTIKWMD